jgi:hypothetical protein
MRGQAAKLNILNQVGPMLGLQEAADLLGVTKQAVHKRLQSQSLFGIKYQEELRIPAWQIRDAEVVPGIAGVLKSLDTTDWGKLLFLHTENMQLQGRKPKDLILEGKGIVLESELAKRSIALISTSIDLRVVDLSDGKTLRALGITEGETQGTYLESQGISKAVFSAGWNVNGIRACVERCQALHPWLVLVFKIF